MIKLRWIQQIPRQWLEIATQSLEVWKERDEEPPFHLDNRKGYARVTPVALSKAGVPNTALLTMDEYPVEGLGSMMILSLGNPILDMCGLVGQLR